MKGATESLKLGIKEDSNFNSLFVLMNMSSFFRVKYPEKSCCELCTRLQGKHSYYLFFVKSRVSQNSLFNLLLHLDTIYFPSLKENINFYFQEKIKDLLVTEKVDWWIPVSHTNTAVVDTMIKEELEEEGSKVKVLCMDSVKTAEMLDDKISFLEEAKELSLPVPEFYKISSCQDVLRLWRQGKILMFDVVYFPLMCI